MDKFEIKPSINQKQKICLYKIQTLCIQMFLYVAVWEFSLDSFSISRRSIKGIKLCKFYWINLWKLIGNRSILRNMFWDPGEHRIWSSIQKFKENTQSQNQLGRDISDKNSAKNYKQTIHSWICKGTSTPIAKDSPRRQHSRYRRLNWQYSKRHLHFSSVMTKWGPTTSAKPCRLQVCQLGEVKAKMSNRPFSH